MMVTVFVVVGFDGSGNAVEIDREASAAEAEHAIGQYRGRLVNLHYLSRLEEVSTPEPEAEWDRMPTIPGDTGNAPTEQ